MLADASYPEDAIARVGALIRKEELETDAEVQAREDARLLGAVGD